MGVEITGRRASESDAARDERERRDSGIRAIARPQRRSEPASTLYERTRVFTLAATVLFGGFAFFDLIVCGIGGRGPLAAVWLLRTAGLLPVVAAHVFARRAVRADASTVRFLASFAIVSMTASVAAMTLLTGGYRSPYHASQMILAFSLGFLPMPWHRGVRLALGSLALHVGLAIVLPLLAPRFVGGTDDPGARAHVAIYTLYVAAAWVVAVVVSNVLWVTRRAVVEAKRVGRYRVDRLLAQGGMGEIWAAYDSNLHREVALKILTPEQSAGAEAATRFESEVHAMTKLTHPNSVRVYDSGVTDEGALFFAMELLEGENLAALVRREGPLSPRRAATLALQAARALSEAHDLGIVHRDLKPENLFLQRTNDNEDFVKVLDFGIATWSVPRPTTSITWPPALFGTPGTASPEVIEGKSATPESDVYGLGAVLYYLLTGSLPFTTDHVMATMIAHLTLAPVAPSERRGSAVPKPLEDLVLRCLSKRPSERFADARALAEALDRALAEMTARPRAISTRVRMPKRPADGRPRPLRPRPPRDLLE